MWPFLHTLMCVALIKLFSMSFVKGRISEALYDYGLSNHVIFHNNESKLPMYHDRFQPSKFDWGSPNLMSYL